MKSHTRAAAFLVVLLLVSPRLMRGQRRIAGPEQELFNSANREREKRGLPPLKWDDALAGCARQHSQRMAQQNALSHQFSREPDLAARAREAGARFSSVAENVAEGPSVGILHSEWMKSPAHRENLLDPDLNSIGVAVSERNGQFFATEDFAHTLATLSLEEQERQLAVKLQARGLRMVFNQKDARHTCALDGGYAGDRTTTFVIRYLTADLSVLPKSLEQQIKNGRYHAAAVGACSPGSQVGFSEYRVAVLLYE